MLASSMCLYISLAAMPDLHRCCETPVLNRAEWAVLLELLGWWALRGGQWSPAGWEVYGVQSPSTGKTEVHCSESQRTGLFHTARNGSAESGPYCIEHIWESVKCWSNQCISYYEAISPATFWEAYLNTSSLVLQSCHAVFPLPSWETFLSNTNMPLKVLILCGKLHCKQSLLHCDLGALELLDTLKPVRALQIHAMTSVFPLMLHGKKTMTGEESKLLQKNHELGSCYLWYIFNLMLFLAADREQEKKNPISRD